MAEDLDRLQGSWRITSLEMDGQTLPAALLASAGIVVAGGGFTTTGMGAEYQGSLELVGGTPLGLDLRFDSGPEAGRVNAGIYQLEVDAWKLCLATRGGPRPTEFASAPGSGHALESLVRGVPGPAAGTPPVAAQPAGNQLEGEWQLQSAVMDGQPMEAAHVPWVTRQTRGNRTTVRAGGRTMLDAELTLPAAPLGAIDYRNLAGAHKGKCQLGIYRFQDGLLAFCMAAPGQARPERLESLPSDGRTLTVWRRTAA